MLTSFTQRLDGQGNPRLLEANPNCGWCWDGHLPKTAALCGINYSQFFEMIMNSLTTSAKEQIAVSKDEYMLSNPNTPPKLVRNAAEVVM